MLIDLTTTLLPEIMSEIFVKCLPEDINLTGRVDEAPVNVSQVSRGWREIALSTAKLWSTLIFFGGQSDSHSHPVPDKGRQFMTSDAWRLWGQRSKAQPLSVFLRGIEENSNADIQRYLQSICSLDEGNRWKELCLSVLPAKKGVEILALSPASLGQLEVLCMTNMFITTDARAPYTKHISMEYDFNHLTGQVVTIPSRLRVIDVELTMPKTWILNSEGIDSFDYGTMMSILYGASSHLSYFGFSLSAKLYIFRHHRFESVFLSNLRTLKLQDNVHAARFFLDHITAPFLETMWLTFRRDIYWGDTVMTPEDRDCITGFLSRSKAPITDLKICVCGFDDEDIRQILCLVPQVQNLRIDASLSGRFRTVDNAVSFFQDLQKEGICLELVTVYFNLRVPSGDLGGVDAQASFLFTIPFPIPL